MTRRHFGELPPNTVIPLSMAHLVVGCDKSTPYRWVKDGLLATTDTPKGKSVTVGQVRAADASVSRGRSGILGSKKVAPDAIEFHVD